MTFLKVTVAYGPILPTRAPPEFLGLPLMTLTPESIWAFSAWKIWPRHTFIGWLNVWPLPTHDSAPSL
jgi:hypothetical protein